MKAKATLKQIAKEFEVSISTVSKALSDSPEISEATKTKIMVIMVRRPPRTVVIDALPSKAILMGLLYISINFRVAFIFFYLCLINVLQDF